MPTTLHTVAEDNISVRYEAPLLSRDINQKIVAAMPHGVYRGLKLGTSASVLTVDLEVDPDHSDHMAVIETLDGFGISVKISGVVPLDLSAYTTKTVVIALYGEYAVGSDTTAEFRAYELSPTDEFTGAAEKNELVVLGTVVVPASGLIALTSMSPRYRTSSWDFEAPERVQWTPLLRDPMFMSGEDGSQPESTRYWRETTAAGSGYWEVSSGSTVPPVFGPYSMFLHITSGPYSTYIYQDIDVPVAPGQYYYVRLYFQEDVGISGGTLGVKLTFDDEFMSSSSVVTHTIDFTSLSAGWNRIDFAGQVAASGASWLRRIQIDASAITGGDVGWFDAAQVFLEEKTANISRNAGTMLDRVVADRILLVLGNLAAGNLVGSDGIALQNAAQVLELVSQTTGLKTKTFATGQTVLGEDLQTTAAQAELPRIKADANTNTNFTLLLESEWDAFTPPMRLYIDNDGAFNVTHNARWETTGPLWYADQSGQQALKFVFSAENFRSYRTNAGTGSWNDGSWDDNVLSFQGRIEELGNSYRSTDAEAAVPRIGGAHRAGTYTCLWQSLIGTTTPGLRLYTYDGNFVVTYNAEWTGTAWDYDSSTTDARKFTFDVNGLTAAREIQPHGATWTDATWDEDFLELPDAVEIGANLLGSLTNAARPRIITPGRSTSWTCLLEAAESADDVIRLYIDPVGTLAITHNAGWDGSNWTSDDVGGDDAYKFEFGTNGFTGYRKEAPPASWAETAWDTPAYIDSDSQWRIGGDMTTDAAENALPRIIFSTNTTYYTQLFGTTVTTTIAQMRVYKSDAQEFVVTFNARWDGTNWNADNTSDNAHKYTFGELGPTTEYKASGTATWNDISWDKKPIEADGLLNLKIGGRVDLGGELDDTTAQAQAALLDMDYSGPTGGRTLLIRSAGAASGPKLRVYHDVNTNENDFWITSNAYWNGNWNADDTGEDAYALRFLGGVLYIEKQTATAGTWTDSTWSVTTQNQLFSATVCRSSVFRSPDSYLHWDAATYTNANPAYTAGFTNYLHAKNVVKCWGEVVITAGAITNRHGYNLGNCSIGTGNLVVTPPAGFVQETGSPGGTAPAGAVAVSGSGPTELLQCTIFTTTSFTIAMYNSTTGASVPLNGGGITTSIRFIVIAPQGASA